MGNQISQPSITVPVDALWSDIPNFTVEKRLGSARFMKTVRGRTITSSPTQSHLVVKVFVKPSLDYNLTNHIKQTKALSSALIKVSGACPYSKIIEIDRAVFLCRPYFHSNLYDRISTRPFLSLLERKWIAYQLLSSLSECHAANIQHGDIKSENVMLTSNNQAYLVDFAPFKPASLPVDNPSDFVYFFDASSRRTCYLAPERFTENTNYVDYVCTQPMDIFALGCVLAELFLEGQVLFSLAQLLKFRNREFDIEPQLDLIEDQSIKDMLVSMLQVDPAHRPTAVSLLSQTNVFPVSFQTHFIPFVNDYQNDTNQVHLKYPGSHPWSQSDTRLIKTWTIVQRPEFAKDLLLLTLSHITCCIRSLTYPQTFIMAIDALVYLSSHIADEHRLDRLVPYLCWIIQNMQHSLVRAAALESLTQILKSVSSIRSEDVGLFPEILFPMLTSIVSDHDTIVRAVFATSLSDLSASSVQFLEHARQLNEAEQVQGNITLFPLQSSDVALADVQRTFLEYLQILISDESIIVRRAILNMVGQIAEFFGRQTSVDVILSHMITYLNEKDQELRSAFFHALVGVSHVAGLQSVQEYIFPLMMQAFQDPSVMVVHNFMNALTSLIGLKYLRTIQLRTIVVQVSLFIVHPNVFVRHAALEVIISCCNVVDDVTAAALFVPALQPFLLLPVHTNFLKNGPLDLLRLLKPHTNISPNQPNMTGSVQKNSSSSSSDTFQSTPNSSVNSSYHYSEVCGYSTTVYQRNGRISMQALKLAPRTVFLSTTTPSLNKIVHQCENGSIDSNISAPTMRPPAQTRSLIRQYSKSFSYINSPLDTRIADSRILESPHSLQNSHGFSGWPLKAHAETSTVNATVTANLSRAASSSFVHKSPLALDDWHEDDVIESNDQVFEYMSNGNNPFVYDLIASRTKELQVMVPKSNLSGSRLLVHHLEQGKLGSNTPKQWMPKGDLLATLTEHTAPVNQVCTLMDGTILVTAASDGNIKVWDTSRILKNRGTQSRVTHRFGGNVCGLAVLRNVSNVVVAGSDAGKIQILHIHAAKRTIKILEEHSLPPGEAVTCMAHLYSPSESIVLVASSTNTIYGLAVDGSGFVFTLSCPPAYGFITAMLVDARNSAWVLVGTLSGTLALFDLRFKVLVRAHAHPSQSAILILCTFWSLPDHVVVAAGKGMLYVYNLALMQCVYVFTRFPVERQGRMQAKLVGGDDFVQNSVKVFEGTQSSHGIYAAFGLPKTDFVVFAGSDCNVRMWSPMSGQATIVLGNVHHVNDPEITYVVDECDGAQLITEKLNARPSPFKDRKSSTNVGLKLGERRVQAINHMDCITDITLIDYFEPPLLVTSSRDGMVKIWR